MLNATHTHKQTQSIDYRRKKKPCMGHDVEKYAIYSTRVQVYNRVLCDSNYLLASFLIAFVIFATVKRS